MTVLACLSSMPTSLMTRTCWALHFLWSLLSLRDKAARPVYLTVYLFTDCNVCFVKACRSNVKLLSWLVSYLDTSILASVSVSDEKCLDSITANKEWKSTLTDKCRRLNACTIQLETIHYGSGPIHVGLRRPNIAVWTPELYSARTMITITTVFNVSQ